jgi:hypothetical protein
VPSIPRASCVPGAGSRAAPARRAAAHTDLVDLRQLGERLLERDVAPTSLPDRRQKPCGSSSTCRDGTAVSTSARSTSRWVGVSSATCRSSGCVTGLARYADVPARAMQVRSAEVSPRRRPGRSRRAGAGSSGRRTGRGAMP